MARIVFFLERFWCARKGQIYLFFFLGGGGGEFLVTSGIAIELHSFGKGFGLVGIARIKFPLSYSYIEI